MSDQPRVGALAHGFGRMLVEHERVRRREKVANELQREGIRTTSAARFAATAETSTTKVANLHLENASVHVDEQAPSSSTDVFRPA